MTPFTSNYETIKDSSLEDKSLDTPSQSKIQSTFLQSVLSNKLVVAFVVVVLGTGLMAYNTNPVPPSDQFRLGEYAAIVDGSKGGGFTGTKNGGASDSGCHTHIFREFNKNGNKSKNPHKNSN